MSSYNSLEKLVAKRPLNGAKAILAKYMPMSIDCAFSICELLHCDNEEFFWKEQLITMQHLAGHYSPSADICKIEIRFYGGPLGRGAWHIGSVQTFLMDHVANMILIDGYIKTKTRFNV
jgi:DNA-binding XRE family transcriptional regulator